MSLKNNFMRFDVFRKMPKDLTEPTFFGAIGTLLYTHNFSSFNHMYSYFGNSNIG